MTYTRVTFAPERRKNHDNRLFCAIARVTGRRRSGRSVGRESANGEIIVIPIKRRLSVKIPVPLPPLRPVVRKGRNKSTREGGTCAGETSKSNIDSRLCARRASRDAGPPLLSDYSH